MNQGATYRILVLDDDESVHGVYGLMLASAPDFSDSISYEFGSANEEGSILTEVPPTTTYPEFEVDFGFQGREGLEMVEKAELEKRPYAMAFVDMRMPPGWNGIETISQLWRANPNIQIVLCTGYADFTSQDLIRQFGHNNRLLVLKKPFDAAGLRQVAYSLAEKWDLAHEAQSNLQRLQSLVDERTAKLQEANHSLQRKINENKQAERRLRTQYSVSQALAQANSVENTLEVVFQIVCRSLDWQWAALWQVDPQANLLKLGTQWNPANSDFEAFTLISRETLLEPGGGLPGRSWTTGKAIWLKDLKDDTDFRRASPSGGNVLHSAVAFPITCGSGVFGIVEFLGIEARECDQDMMQTFEVIGSAIGQFLDRKQTEDDLRRQRDYINQIIHETPALVAGISPEGIITFVNPSVTRHTGYAADELIGHNWWMLFFPGDAEKQLRNFLDHLEKGSLRDYEMEMVTLTGGKRTISWNILTKKDSKGQLTELIGFGNDITERKQAELQRAAMEIQLRHSQKLESIGQLAAGIAHEINTPTQYLGDNIRFLQTSFHDLNEIHAAYACVMAAAARNELTQELLAETSETIQRNNHTFLLKEIPKAIQQSLEGVDRVARIVRAMKDFSHPGTGRKTPIDLNKAIETTMTVAGNEWKYVARVETDLAPNLPLVPCMPGEFNQVILNLVVNAAHAIGDVVDGSKKEMGLIRVSTRLVDDFVEIRVKDTGTGIAEKIRDRVFDPFFTTKPVGKGTGQGLAIAHNVIVDQHQGQIFFESEIGVGTVFIIRLPVQPEQRTQTKGRL